MECRAGEWDPRRKLGHRVGRPQPLLSVLAGGRFVWIRERSEEPSALPRGRPRRHWEQPLSLQQRRTFRKTNFKIISMETIYSDFPHGNH